MRAGRRTAAGPTRDVTVTTTRYVPADTRPSRSGMSRVPGRRGLVASERTAFQRRPDLRCRATCTPVPSPVVESIRVVVARRPASTRFG